MRTDEPHRAGQAIEDLCRVCKAVRDHTVIAVDPRGHFERLALRR